MWLRLKIAFRNTFRNTRRTTLNILMIAGGVAALILFQGFAQRMVMGLRETTIKTQTGHLQIATRAYWNKNGKTPEESLINGSEKLIKQLRKNKHVRYISGRLSFYGLLSKDDKSHSAQGVSFDPKAEKSRAKAFRFFKGKPLSEKNLYQIAVGSGLSKRIGAKPGDQVTILAHTYDGAVNALDMEICGIFETAIAEFDDNSFILPLKSAQTLLDTKGVEQIVVGLDHTTSTAPIMASFNRNLKSLNPDVKVRPWYHLAHLYNQVATFNRIQTKAFQFIILTLILLSILNTVGNSIAERTGEIGTVRALGEKPQSILIQFLLEGVVLGVCGAIAGIISAAIIAHIVNLSHIPLQFPGASAAYIIEIHLLKEAVQEGSILAVVTAVTASLLPAFRASRMNIVEALRKNFQ